MVQHISNVPLHNAFLLYYFFSLIEFRYQLEIITMFVCVCVYIYTVHLYTHTRIIFIKSQIQVVLKRIKLLKNFRVYQNE